MTPEAFDVVSSVTVLQHIPFDEQHTAIRQLRELVKVGGYLLILENIQDQGAHMFAHSMDGWVRLFDQQGFQLVAVRRYDYSPCIRTYRASIRSIKRILGFRVDCVAHVQNASSGDSGDSVHRGTPSALRVLSYSLMKVPVALDRFIDPIYSGITSLLQPTIVGFCFDLLGSWALTV